MDYRGKKGACRCSTARYDFRVLSWGKCLFNAITGEVGTGTKMSGNPTTRVTCDNAIYQQLGTAGHVSLPKVHELVQHHKAEANSKREARRAKTKHFRCQVYRGNN
jgi:hypothetical protein